MSLINRLLQDLDSRLAGQSEGLAVSPHARAIARSQRRSGWKVAAKWLLLLAACAVFAAAYMWKTDSRFKSTVEDLLTSVGAAAPVVEIPTPVAQTVKASVEVALMVPVFQMSSELAFLPARVQRTSPDDSTKAISLKSGEKQARRGSSNGAGSNSDPIAMRESKDQGGVIADMATRVKRTEQTKPTPQKKKPAEKESASHNAVVAPSRQVPSKISTPAQSPELNKVTVASAATANPVEIKKSDEAVEDKPEEVVIPADLTSSPIERQARALTSYERAENAFLKGVRHLRQGRMNDAEASFRSAIMEDRSHASARQALVGILIEAGRNADAEAVLVEALGVNPRQPQQAMLLARLQVERGDLRSAVLTLERARDYATNDAGFISFHAAVLQRATRHDEAVSQYRNALALVQENAIWSMGLGISLRALGDTAGAKDAFRTAASAGTLSKELQAFVEQQFLQLNRAAR